MHTLLPRTGTPPRLSALRSGDLASVLASATLAATVTGASGLLAASRAGNPATAAARSIGCSCLGLGAEKTRKAKPSGAGICTFGLCLLPPSRKVVALPCRRFNAFSLGEKNEGEEG